MTTHQEEHYYVSIKPALMEEFEKTESYLKNVLKQYFDQSKIELLLKETRAGYEDLLPQLPYIGGEENVLTEGLIGAAWCVPLFRGSKEKDCHYARWLKSHMKKRRPKLNPSPWKRKDASGNSISLPP
jgi:hypothetical protein